MTLNMLQRRAAAAARMFKVAAGVAIVYARAGVSVALTAVKKEDPDPVLDPAGLVVIEVGRQDWQVVATELVLGGVQITPQPGDTITEGSDVFEVRPDGDLPCFRDTAGGVFLRIKTKQRSS